MTLFDQREGPHRRALFFCAQWLGRTPTRQSRDIKAGAFEHPVLIDPVRCQVWDVSGLVSTQDWIRRLGVERHRPCYALDYPLFLADLRVLSE